MRVDVDEARRDDHAGGVDHLARLGVGGQDTHRGDDAVVDRDIGGARRRTGAVDHLTVADHEIMHAFPLSRHCAPTS